MEIIALVNVKGGVGKTTTTVNAAHAMARSGRQVLVVDFDPQGNATTCLGIDCANRYTVLDLIRSTAKVDEVFTDPIPGVRLLPADLGLADAELAGATAMHQTIYDFAPSSSGATDYTALCDEIIDRTGGWA